MFKLIFINRLIVAGIFFLVGVLGAQARSQDAVSADVYAGSVVYVAPDGDDSRTGNSPTQALRSLKRVQTMLKDGVIKIQGKQLSVKFLPGTYYQMGVTWDYVAPDHTIVFEPSTSSPGKFPVVLDGTGDELGQFFLLRITSPTPEPVKTGIIIRGFHITNYCEGVSLGDWKSKARITGNLVEGNQFSRIGSKYEQPTLQADGRRLPEGRCVAAVRVKNAVGNMIRNNVFAQIENLPAGQTAARKYGPTLLHALYISNGSSDNRIENNHFSKFTGSPVRIRAESNNNVIIANTFISPIYLPQNKGKYRISAVTQWYCNEAVEICRNRAEDGVTECPSTGIEIVANKVGAGMDIYADDSQSKRATCATAASVPESRREPKLRDNVVNN
jgi:hypothetical protein